MKIVHGVLTLCILLSACSAPSTNTQAPVEAKKITSTGVVHAAVKPINLEKGGTGELLVSLKIDSGYHVNANPPTYPYLKATELEITPGDGFSVNYLTYPTALTKKFPFAEKPLVVYEGDTDLKVSLKANAKASPGEHSIPAVLRVQACDDQVCYPPGQIDLRIPVTIK